MRFLNPLKRFLRVIVPVLVLNLDLINRVRKGNGESPPKQQVATEVLKMNFDPVSS